MKKYYVCFWLKYKRINDWQKVIEKIEKGEKKILRFRDIRDLIQEKIERHFDETYGHLFIEKKEGLPTYDQLLDHSWKRLKLKYVAGSKHRSYSEEEDAFLLAMMHRHGYGATERIRLEIRRAFQFRFNWFFKSRSRYVRLRLSQSYFYIQNRIIFVLTPIVFCSLEIQRRCESIVKMVEKEIADIRKQEEEEEAQKTTTEGAVTATAVQAP